MKRESFVWENANVLKVKCSNVRKRSKLSGSDSANNASRASGGDREGCQEDMFNRDGRIS